jgi:hypothetical protein
MKSIMTLILMTALTYGTALDSETDNLDTCDMWNRMDRSAKSGFVFGWARAAKAAGVVADTYVKTSTVPKVNFGVETIIDKILWPTGHRFGSLIIEISAECAGPEKHKQSITESIQKITSRLNAPQQ